MNSNWNGTGNLGKDPERRTFANGSTVVRGRIAVNQGKDKEPMWLGVTVWAEEHPVAAKALEDAPKGRRVDVVGRLSCREYEGREYFDVTASSVRVWPPREGDRPTGQQYSGGGSAKHHQDRPQRQRPAEGWGSKPSPPASNTRADDIPYSDDEDIPF